MARLFTQRDQQIDREFSDVDRRLTNLESSDNIPIGGCIIWTGISPPAGYLWCDGQSYSVLTYPKLYQILERRGGTPTPNNEDSFAVPSLTNGSFTFIIRAE